MDPTFFTVPRSVTVPSPFVVRVRDVRSSDRLGDSEPPVTVKLTLAYVGTDPVIANGVTLPSPRRPANAFVLSVATTLPPALRNVAFTVARPTVDPLLLRTSPTIRTAPPPAPAVVRQLFTGSPDAMARNRTTYGLSLRPPPGKLTLTR